MAIEAERLLAIFEAKFDSLDKALAKSRTAANSNFAAIEAAGTRAEAALGRVGSKGAPGFDRLAKSAQGAKIQTSNLAAQLNDIGVQLAGGQSPFLIALQQGTQIQQALGEAGAKGAVTALGGAFASLANPVGLVTIATIALGGVAVQYFASLLSNGEKSAETLKQEADLIQKVASQWGAALPALKAYADEQSGIADQQDKINALLAARDRSSAPLVQGFNEATAEIADLMDQLNVLGENAAAQQLREKFEELRSEVESGSVTQQDFNDVIDAAKQTFADAKINGNSFIAMLEALAGRAAALIPTMASLAGEVDKVFGGAGSPNGRSPTGKTMGYDPRFNLPDTAPTPDSAPNREDVLAAQDRRAAAAARRNSRKSEAEREAEAVAKYIDQLEFEYSMLGKTDQEREVANALRRAGAAATDEQKQKIADLVVATDREKEALKANADAARFFQDTLAGAFRDLIPEINTGNQALDNLLNTLIDVIAQAALLGQGPLRGLFGGGLLSGIGAGGGLLGGAIIPGILHSGGTAGSDGYGHGKSYSAGLWAKAPRYHNGTLSAGEVPAILKRGEVVDPGDGSVFAKRFGGTQNVHVSVGVDVDESGNLMPFVRNVSTQSAAGVVNQARPQLASDAVNSVQHASRKRPGLFR